MTPQGSIGKADLSPERTHAQEPQPVEVSFGHRLELRFVHLCGVTNLYLLSHAQDLAQDLGRHAHYGTLTLLATVMSDSHDLALLVENCEYPHNSQV